jgi:DNA invertase Pin-like site-specific DNA recombinase
MTNTTTHAALRAQPSEPKAYSYIRFSTPEQAKGHSLQRQSDAARAWADQNDVPLDTELTFADKGISGFTGANMETGALGAFLECVRDGTVPRGSWLLVESLDRISRQVARRAVRAIEDIVEAGVTVVDLSDGGRAYSAETLDSDAMLFVMMVLRFVRANEESTLKGSRVAAKYEQKRQTFAGKQPLDKPYTRRLPAWIRWNDDGKVYELIPDRAALLRQIFEKTIEGWGQQRIARWLNSESVDTWGAGGWKAKYWHKSYIRKLLANPATVGTFQPHKMTGGRGPGKAKGRKPLEPIHHRFPPAIEREMFDRVADRLATVGARGRHSSRESRSIFAGIIKCEHCGGTVTRVTKGKHVYLVCSVANARGGTCKYETVPYQEAEDALRQNIAHTIAHAPRGNDTTELQETVARQMVAADLAADRVRELLNITITDKSRAARRMLQEGEREHEESEARLRQSREKLDKMTTVNVATRLQAVEDALTGNLGIDATNRALKQAIRMMIMKPAEGTLLIHWHHAEEPQEVTFHTRRFNWKQKRPWEAAGAESA